MYNPYQANQGNYQQGFGNQGQGSAGMGNAPPNYGQGAYTQPMGQQYGQYGQAYGQYGQQFGQPQQPGLFQGQQTGFSPQQTFQAQPTTQQTFQPQQTGFQPQQTGFQPQQTGFQPQQTGFQPQQPLQAQATGFSAAVSGVPQNKELKIPNIRLSFITASDQSKFETLFRTAVQAGDNALSGDAARDILLKSGLSPVTLAEVWALSDTNKSGSLLFPEFALALHLCNMALKGDALPRQLPEKWSNEVQSYVDAISFSVPEDPDSILANTPFASYSKKPDDWMSGNAPVTSFTAQKTGGFQPIQGQQTGGFQPIQGQQTGGFQPIQGQQTGGFQPIQGQRTGGGTLIPMQPQHTASFVAAQPSLQSQATGPLKAQNTGFNGGSMPPTSFQAQQTGGFQAQQTGGFQPQTGLQPQATGQVLQPQTTGFQNAQVTGFQPAPLQAQPTGKPGQWGFVSTPTGGLPGLNAMQSHFLPSSQLPSNNLQNAMGGRLKENVTWAITKQEKQIYDGVFAAWDKSRKGFIEGDVAITIFSKSGLSRPDLESIWSLCDESNRGKLNKDEFAVAMHLVYRRLNGLEIPLRLPPELVPPSAKYLQDSVDSLKNSLKGGTGAKKAAPKASTSASRFKNDDDELAYISNSRRRSRNAVEVKESSVSSSKSNDLTISDLKKLIREKQILLDATDVEDQHKSIGAKREQEANFREIETLKSQILQIQSQLTSPSGSGNDEKSALLRSLDHYTRDKVPMLISRIHQVNVDIAQAKTELAKKSLKKEYPSWNPENSAIEATGPNGTITESDRQKAKSKQLLRQRMAALTGKQVSGGSDADADIKWQSVVEKSNKERDDQSNMIKDIEASIKELEDSAASRLQVSLKSESDVRRWEKGEGVSNTLKTFIQELQAFGRNEASQSQSQGQGQSQSQATSAISTPQSTGSSAISKPSGAKPAYTTPEERSAYIKAQAEKRMNERLAKLGISRNKTGSPASSVASPEPAAKAPVQPPAQALAQPPVQSPAVQAPAVQSPAVQSPAVQSPAPTQSAQSTAQSTVSSAPAQPAQSETHEDTSDDDEEYKLLLKQKAEMEARKKERALKKAQDKEARLAKLREEMKRMKDQSDDDWSDDDLKPKTPSYTPMNIKNPTVSQATPAVPVVPSVNSAPVNTSSTPASVQSTGQSNVPVTDSVQSTGQSSVPVTSSGPGGSGEQSNSQSNVSMPIQTPSVDQKPPVHDSNPFAKSGATGQANTNPFFKPTDTTPVNQKKLEAQRASQRGMDSEDWSDDEQKSSDDDEPNRAGAAKLASLLFGGMPQPSKTEPEQAAPVQAEVPAPPPVPAQPSVPAQPPVPVQSETAAAPIHEVHEQVSSGGVLGVNGEEFSSTDSNDEFATPSPEFAPAQDIEVPPIPSAPPIPTSIPPPPPPVPATFPPPPAPAPPLPAPAPPAPAPPPMSAPAPPAPAPPPPSFSAPSPPAIPPTSGPPAGGLSALLGQIQGGKALKKVNDSEKRIAENSVAGRVLD